MVTLPTQSNVPKVGLRSDPGVSIPRSQTGAVLGEVAGFVGGVADSMIAAQARTDNRQDTVDRARSVREFNALANNELRRIETEGDLSTRETTEGFGKFLQENKSRIFGGHAGSEDSRAQLSVRLDDIAASVGDSAAVKSVAAQRALVSDVLAQDLNDAAIRVINNPASVLDELQIIDDSVLEMSSALTPTEARDKADAGKAVLISNAADTMMSQSNIEGVKALLETQGVPEILGQDSMLKLNTRIAKVERDIEQDTRKAQVEAENKLKTAEIVKGAPLTPNERLQLSGLAPSAGRQTFQEKTAEIEAVLGKPLSPTQLEKLAGVDEAEGGGTFGKGFTGIALQTVTDMAPAFGEGLLSPEDERQFASAVSVLKQPTQFTNPDTGVLETRSFPLPAFLTDALRKRGLEETPQTDAVSQFSVTPEAPQELGQEQPAEFAPGEIDPSDPLQGLPTIFDLASTVSGPGASITETLGGLPVVGGQVNAAQVTQARQRIQLLQRDLVKSLQNNPRLQASEREAIEGEIDIEGVFFDNPTAFQNRAKGIDDALRTRVADKMKILSSPGTGKEERISAMRVLNDLESFRIQLGVPPTVKTPEEAASLPVGSQFFDPNGILRNVTEESKAQFSNPVVEVE